MSRLSGSQEFEGHGVGEELAHRPNKQESKINFTLFVAHHDEMAILFSNIPL